MVANNIKFFQKTKNKAWLSIEKKSYEVWKNITTSQIKSG